MNVRSDPGGPAPTARVILRPSFYVWRFLIWGLLLWAGMNLSSGLRAMQDGLDARNWGLNFGVALVIVLIVGAKDVRIWRQALEGVQRLPGAAPHQSASGRDRG